MQRKVTATRKQFSKLAVFSLLNFAKYVDDSLNGYLDCRAKNPIRMNVKLNVLHFSEIILSPYKLNNNVPINATD